MKSERIKHGYTLIELLIALAIILMISGLIFVSVKKPVFLTFDKNVRAVETLFAMSSREALITGKTISISYDRENKKFRVSKETGTDVDSSSSETPDTKYNSCKLPEEVALERTDGKEDEPIVFRFFPDATASGPQICFETGGHKATLEVSPLTGSVTLKHIDEDE